ncbi:hypothetical protein T01_1506 [Trichinella spiralis]|uniref:Uncharacterized protein n=1 Tax=Trichinella spiralis TaxID=6334 RepID=A0A0V1BGP7_TRISP|nr:hypothetical protein T01_1506 [Trichinella spiralis]
MNHLVRLSSLLLYVLSRLLIGTIISWLKQKISECQPNKTACIIQFPVQWRKIAQKSRSPFAKHLLFVPLDSSLHSTVQCLVFFNESSNFFLQFSSRLKIVAFARRQSIKPQTEMENRICVLFRLNPNRGRRLVGKKICQNFPPIKS